MQSNIHSEHNMNPTSTMEANKEKDPEKSAAMTDAETGSMKKEDNASEETKDDEQQSKKSSKGSFKWQGPNFPC
jgi:hypothetical protein